MVVLGKYHPVVHFLQKENFKEGFIYELLNGTIVKLSTANPFYQIILLNFVRILDKFIQESKPGILFISPIDVILGEENLVIPDLFLYKKAEKISLLKKVLRVNLIWLLKFYHLLRLVTIKKMKLYKKHQIPENIGLLNPKHKS